MNEHILTQPTPESKLQSQADFTLDTVAEMDPSGPHVDKKTDGLKITVNSYGYDASTARIDVRTTPSTAENTPSLDTTRATTDTPNAPAGGFDRQYLIDVMGGKLENVRRDGQDLSAKCPECEYEGKSGGRSFYSRKKYSYQWWKCRNCDHSASTQQLLGLTFHAAPRPDVKEWRDTGPDAQDVAATRTIYASLADYAQASAQDNQRFIEYIQGRGLSLQFASAFGLGYIDWPLYRQWFAGLTPDERATATNLAGLPDGNNERAKAFAGGYQGKIVFPYRDDSSVVDIRTRSISPNDSAGYLSPKRGYADRGVDAPYGVESLTGNRIVLTEGEFKALVPMAHGADVPIVALRGTNDPIENYLDHLRGRLIILAFDNDDTPSPANGLTPGQMATIKVGRTLQANHVDVMVLNPSLLRDQKGLDDFVNAYGIDEFNKLLAPSSLMTLAKFEAHMSANGADLSKLPMPTGNANTARQWTPDSHIDDKPHEIGETVSLDEASAMIRNGINEYVINWVPGTKPLVIESTAGTGKTTITAKELTAWADDTGKTLSFILPNHATIDEKIIELDHTGERIMPTDTRHIHGHTFEKDAPGAKPGGLVQTCKQADIATTLIVNGFNASDTICLECPFQEWCSESGYRSQFKRNDHRAYVHAHMFTNYPYELGDVVVIDELSHRNFIDTTTIELFDIRNVVQAGKIASGEQLDLLQGLTYMLGSLHDGELEGQVFYEVRVPTRFTRNCTLRKIQMGFTRENPTDSGV